MVRLLNVVNILNVFITRRDLARKIHARVYRKHLKQLENSYRQHERVKGILTRCYQAELKSTDNKLKSLRRRVTRKERQLDEYELILVQKITQASEVISKYEKRLFDYKVEKGHISNDKLYLKESKRVLRFSLPY